MLVTAGVAVLVAATIGSLPVDLVDAGVWVSWIAFAPVIDIAGATGVVDADALEATPWIMRILARTAVRVPAWSRYYLRAAQWGLGVPSGLTAQESIDQCVLSGCGPGGHDASGFYTMSGSFLQSFNWTTSLRAGSMNPAGAPNPNDPLADIDAAIDGPMNMWANYCADCSNQFPGVMPH